MKWLTISPLGESCLAENNYNCTNTKTRRKKNKRKTYEAMKILQTGVPVIITKGIWQREYSGLRR